MRREEILSTIKKWGEEMMIDPYIFDVLTDGSSYAENWLNQLDDAENENDLWMLVQSMFCTR